MTQEQKNLIDVIKSIENSMESYLSFTAHNDKKMADFYRHINEEKERKKQRRKKELLSYLHNLRKELLETGRNNRNGIIKKNRTALLFTSSEAEINDDIDTIILCNGKERILNKVEANLEALDVDMEPKSLDAKGVSSFDLISEASSGLNQLRKSLIGKKLINDVEPHDFKSIFYADLETKKVDWNTWGELRYFVKRFCEQKSLFRADPTDSLVIASACFTVKGKTKTNKQLSKVHYTSKQTSRNAIDGIINSFAEECRSSNS